MRYSRKNNTVHLIDCVKYIHIQTSIQKICLVFPDIELLAAGGITCMWKNSIR